jgi:hypothetical protein
MMPEGQSDAVPQLGSTGNLAASDLFDQAEAYRQSAATLQSAGLDHYLSPLPVRNLYYTSIELYLKAHLRAHGHSIDELEGKYRRDFRRMRKRCISLGLVVTPAQDATLEYFVRTPASVRTKFSSTQYYSAPEINELDDLCQTLRSHISALLRPDNDNQSGKIAGAGTTIDVQRQVQDKQ